MTNLKDLMLGDATGAKLTLAVAESLTCGHLQARIGAISGASGFFLGGITAYTLEQKIKLLGVPREIAEPVDCVSEAVAIAMAKGACSLFGADLSVATTGYAEPAPAQKVGQPYAWFAIAHKRPFGRYDTISRRVDCPGKTRIAVQEEVARAAFEALVRYLS